MREFLFFLAAAAVFAVGCGSAPTGDKCPKDDCKDACPCPKDCPCSE